VKDIKFKYPTELDYRGETEITLTSIDLAKGPYSNIIRLRVHN